MTNELGDGDDEDLRKELMSNLSQMAKTNDKDACTMLEGVIRQLIENRAPRFLQYLEQHYLYRKEQWCRSFRDMQGFYAALVTSMHIESSFRQIKTSYHGFANRRLVNLVTNLILYAADQERAVKTDAVRPTYSSVELTISRKHRENAKPYFENQHWIADDLYVKPKKCLT